MNNFDLATNLSERIKYYFELANKREDSLCSFEFDFATKHRCEEEWREEYAEALEGFLFYLKVLLRDIDSMANLLGLRNIVIEIASIDKSTKNLSKTESDYFDHRIFSPILQQLGQIFSSMRVMIEVNDLSSLSVFENILENTAVIINAEKIEPKNETQVSARVFSILKYAFADAIKPSIPQLTKHYKPDLGVVSLKAAAEYKFATTPTELMKSMGGIYEDMHGYSGSSDWEVFYSVIYMTKPFITKKVLLKEMGATKAPKNWQLILVNGAGDKKKKINA